MEFRPRVALVAAAVVTALVSGVQGRDVNDASLQFQLGTLLFEETRYREALDAFRRAVGADSKSLAVQARIGVVKSALRLGEFIEAQKEATTLKQQEPRSADVLAVHADALWSAGLFDEAHQEFKDALVLVPDLSRGHHGLARALASQNKLEEALNEAQVALKLVAARRGNPPHRRIDLRAHAPLRAGGGRLRQLRQPAAEQGSQRQGGMVALADPLPAIVRRARADRDRRGRGGSAAHRGLPRHRRQGDRQGPRQRRPRAGLRARYRLGADDDFAADRIERGGAPDHLHAERRRG